ncbi:MAG: hypothetical protein AB7E52_07075, partial [Bdellovibrionales bacterium]
MLKTYSQRVLMLPLVVLVVFLTLYAVVEFKKLSSDSQIRNIINDPLPEMTQELQVSAMHLMGVYELYRPASATRPNSPHLLKNALDDLIEKHHIVMAFLTKDTQEAETHIAEIDRMKRIDDGIKKLDVNFAVYECYQEEIWKESTQTLDTLVGEIRALDGALRQTHQIGANQVLEQIREDEKHRSLLLVLVLASGLALVIVLLDSVHHYKTTADRARAAEKDNALFAAALQNTRVGVLIRDMRKEGCPAVFINAAFTQMTGYAFSDIQQDNSEFLFGWKTDPSAITA